jgi:hypothetical protein
MKSWLLILLFAAGCSRQYTREQAKNCDAAWDAAIALQGAIAFSTPDTPAHTRDRTLAALPAFIDRLRSYRPGSAGADEEINGLLNAAISAQNALSRLDPAATKEDIGTVLNPLQLWFNALVSRCTEVHNSLVAPSVPSPAPFPAG